MNKCVYFAFHGGLNDYFRMGLEVAVRSLRTTNPHLPVFILHDGFTSEQKERLKGCEFIRIDSARLQNTHRSDLTIGAYFKLFVDQLADFDRALYLDSDLVVLDDLEPLFIFRGPIAARREQYTLEHEFADPDKVHRREGLTDQSSYLNSGVMLLDPKFWAAEKLVDQCVEIAEGYGWDFFKNADQGILNILVHRYGRFTEIPREYNYCLWPDMMCSLLPLTKKNTKGLEAPMILTRTQQRLALSGLPGPWKRGTMAKIVHWNGTEKPWKVDVLEDTNPRYYWPVYRQFVKPLS